MQSELDLFYRWAEAHRLASEAESALHAKIREGSNVSRDEWMPVLQSRADASLLLKAMLADMESRAHGLRAQRGSPGASTKPPVESPSPPDLPGTA